MGKSLHDVQRAVNTDFAHCAIAAKPAVLHNMAMQLARIRAARGLSLQELGDMIGMSAATVQRAETMQSTAKLETFIKCAAALKVSLSDIFADDRTAAEQAIIEALRRLPSDRRGLLEDLLKAAEARP